MLAHRRVLTAQHCHTAAPKTSESVKPPPEALSMQDELMNKQAVGGQWWESRVGSCRDPPPGAVCLEDSGCLPCVTMRWRTFSPSSSTRHKIHPLPDVNRARALVPISQKWKLRLAGCGMQQGQRWWGALHPCSLLPCFSGKMSNPLLNHMPQTLWAKGGRHAQTDSDESYPTGSDGRFPRPARRSVGEGTGLQRGGGGQTPEPASLSLSCMSAESQAPTAPRLVGE